MLLSKDLSRANRLIAALPTSQRAAFLEQCELVDLRLHDVVTRAGQRPDHAYFPIDSFVAATLAMENSHAVQVGLIGSEGMVNVSLVLGIHAASLTGIVQGSGRAFRIRQGDLQTLLDGTPRVRDILSRYVAVRMNDLAQHLACSRCHSVEQRLARWLLMARDRAHASELFLTQEVLAFMLGVRRESVTQAATALQKQGLTSYTRGYVMLLDEPGIEAIACWCYQTDRAMYERAMGPNPPARNTGLISTTSSFQKTDQPPGGQLPLIPPSRVLKH